MQLKVEELPMAMCRFPQIKDMKTNCESTGKRQRNGNKKIVNRQMHPIHLEVTAERILSARNHKIIDQCNAIHYLTKQIEDLRTENKTLKTQSFRQDKALNKIESMQSDLPRILRQHESEVLNLKELLRRSKESLATEVKQRKERDSEIIKLRDSLTKANQLIEDKHLDERNNLHTQNKDLLEKLEAKEKCLQELHKLKDSATRAHKRELRELRNEIKRHVSHCDELEHELILVKHNLKEKERLIGIQNIYSHRFKAGYRPGGLQEPHSDQMLDKIDLNSISEKSNEKSTDDIDDKYNTNGTLGTNTIDPERIKHDIRQIIQEEILSGRIKTWEMKQKSPDNHKKKSSLKSQQSVSDDGRSDAHEWYNTGRAVESEIFDKDQHTQIESQIIQIPEPVIDHEAEEIERGRRKLLLDKLKQLDANKSDEEIEDLSKLPYSYPNDNDYLANDRSLSDIETIPAVTVQPSRKTYKFSEPKIDPESDVTEPQHAIDREKSRPSISLSSNSKILQIDNQRNNSNTGIFTTEVLPPLNETDKKRREGELLSELFGEEFTPQQLVHGKPYKLGSRPSRVGNIWLDSEHDTTALNDRRDSVFLESNHMEDIEQIAL